ncbi:MAG: hypothetical protein GEEBNDBF_00069 [bacterium]|nr:hypothetical protein [bacterium]
MLEAPRPPGLAYVLFFLLGVLAINTFYLVFEQEERRFWLWAGLAAGFVLSWNLPRTWRIAFHRLIDLGSVLTLVWFINAMSDPDEFSRFGNYLGQMVCIFLVLFSFRTYRHSDFSWLMVIAIVIMLLCSIPIYAASFIYSIFLFLLLLAFALVALNLYPAEGDHREEEPILTTPEWGGHAGRMLVLSLSIFVVAAGLFAGLPQRGGSAEQDRGRVRAVFGVGTLSAETKGALSAEDLEQAAGIGGGSAYSGFSESFDITTGRSGAIQEDVRPILEVRASGQPYMRALAWDIYNGRSWLRSEQALRRTALHGKLQPGDYGNEKRDIYTLPPHDSTSLAQQLETRALQRAEIKLVGSTNTGQGFLFLPWHPLQVEGNFESLSVDDLETWKLLTDQPEGYPPDTDRYTLSKGDQYFATFEPVSLRRTPLVPAPPLEQAALERYLQLPESVPASIRERGQQLRDPAGDPWATALAVQSYLRSSKRYSLRPPVMGTEVKDVVSYWLDQSEEGGHCELFATSAVVLLRAAGVPSRTVTGFAPGTYSLNKGVWIIRGKDAHAWAEIYVSGRGWVPFDPTPASWGEDVTDTMSEVTSRISRSLEQYFIYDPRSFWTRDVPNHLRTLARSTSRALRQALRESREPGTGGLPQGLWWMLLAGGIAGSVGYLAPFMRYRVPLGDWRTLRYRQTHAWSLRRYELLWRRLQRQRPDLPDGLTLREAGDLLRPEAPELATALVELHEPFHGFHYAAPAERLTWRDRLRTAWRRVPRRQR